VLIVLVATVLGLELVWSVVGGVTGTSAPTTGPSSSFTTAATGTSALATLLTADGVGVVRATTPLDRVRPRQDGTLLVLDPSTWTAGDTTALRHLLARGERVVVAGSLPAAGAVRQLLGGAAPPRLSTAFGYTGTAGVTAAAHGTFAGVSQIETSGASFSPLGSAVALVEDRAGAVAVAPRATSPRLVLLANAAALSNAGLDRSDDALFALDLVGGRGSTVVFDEYDHGYGRTGTGLGALPLRWRVGLSLALLAVLVWLVSASRRFGPVRPAGRLLPPPRIAYVDAMGTVLASMPAARRRAAADPLRAEGRLVLARRLSLPSEIDDATLAAAAVAAGMAPDAISAIIEQPRDDAGLLATGRAVATLMDPGSGNGTGGVVK
jgi:hypothetical protein